MSLQAILFTKCLGLNDARAMGTQVMKVNPRDPEAGHAELIDCLNLTTTPDGCLEKIAPFVTALTHTAPITNISAGKRFLFQDGVDTREWTTGTTVVNRFPITDGPVAHTPIDCRVSGASSVYKSLDAAPTMQAVIAGANPNPATSRAFAAQPAFDHAFVHNSRLYGVNHADPRFLQYSEDYGYDLWNLGDNFIGHAVPILRAGSIPASPAGPGCIVATHAGGVSVYTGSGPADFAKRFYPRGVIDGTLYSGFISKVYGYGHVFVCPDGIYLIDGSGALSKLTVEQTDFLDRLNTNYTCATVQDGKYLAFGNSVCVEYDFKTKTVLKRASFGVQAATVWDGVTYYAVGSKVATLGTEIDTSANFAASLTLPFSDFGAPGIKAISDFYFTGIADGDVTITVTDNVGAAWEVYVSGVGSVFNHRIKAPRGFLGNHISVGIAATSGAFRLEVLKASFVASSRSR